MRQKRNSFCLVFSQNLPGLAKEFSHKIREGPAPRQPSDFCHSPTIAGRAPRKRTTNKRRVDLTLAARFDLITCVLKSELGEMLVGAIRRAPTSIY